jgi:hypothetical protein
MKEKEIETENKGRKTDTNEPKAKVWLEENANQKS